MFMGYFLKKVRELRKEKNISQQQIAEMVGLSRENYNSFEHGRRPLGEKREELLANALGVPVSLLRAWQRLEGASYPEMEYLHQELCHLLSENEMAQLDSSIIKHGVDVVYKAALEARDRKLAK